MKQILTYEDYLLFKLSGKINALDIETEIFLLTANYILSIDLIEHLYNKNTCNELINYCYIQNDQFINEKLIDKYFKYLTINSINIISKSFYLSNNFIDKYFDKLNINYIIKNKKLSNNMISKHFNSIAEDIYSCNDICKTHKLNNKNIIKFLKLKNLTLTINICKHQKLYYDFIQNNISYFKNHNFINLLIRKQKHLSKSQINKLLNL